MRRHRHPDGRRARRLLDAGGLPVVGSRRRGSSARLYSGGNRSRASRFSGVWNPAGVVALVPGAISVPPASDGSASDGATAGGFAVGCPIPVDGHGRPVERVTTPRVSTVEGPGSPPSSGYHASAASGRRRSDGVVAPSTGQPPPWEAEQCVSAAQCPGPPAPDGSRRAPSPPGRSVRGARRVQAAASLGPPGVAEEARDPRRSRKGRLAGVPRPPERPSPPSVPPGGFLSTFLKNTVSGV